MPPKKHLKLINILRKKQDTQVQQKSVAFLFANNKHTEGERKQSHSQKDSKRFGTSPTKDEKGFYHENFKTLKKWKIPEGRNTLMLMDWWGNNGDSYL